MRSSALSEKVLVLNRHWAPIRVCTARRGLVLLFKDLARAMSENYVLHDFPSWSGLSIRDGQPFVQTVSMNIRVPEVIVLTNCDRFVLPRVAFTRRNIFRRDQNTCQYCGRRGSLDDLSIDHVVPRSLGGSANWANCVVACRSCNERKGNRSLRRSGMKLLRQPKEPPPHMVFALNSGNWKASWDQFVRGKVG